MQPRQLEAEVDDDGSGAAVLAALAANVGVALAKIVAWLATRSSSMLAESIHSIADSVNEILLLIGRRAADQAPTKEHPFGYARNRYLFSFLVAVILFVGSGLVVVWRGVTKLQNPEPIEHAKWAIGVLVIAMGLEGASLRTAAKRSSAASGDRPLHHFVRHTKTPELIVVLLEDMGALLGLAIALAGVITTLATGDGTWDAIATCAIGGLMILIAIVLATKTKSLLIGEAAHPPVRSAIALAIVGGEIESVMHLRTQHLGPDHLLIAARVAVAPEATARNIATSTNEAKARVRAALPYDCLIYLEPQITAQNRTTQRTPA